MHGDLDEATRGLALSVVGIDEDSRYRGSAGIRELLTSSVFRAEDAWTVDFAMDSEAVLSSPAGDRVQLLLDCGRISYLRVFQSETVAA